MAKQQIVIVGGGFGGIKAALELARDKRFAVTLLSDRTSFRYYPTLYHVATGGRTANASIPLSVLFDGKPVRVEHGNATGLDRANKQIITSDGRRFGYDSAILALGVVTNYFGIEGLAEYSYGIKSVEEVMRLKHHIHKQIVDHKGPDLNYVIVGGGPTGIELAGALPAYIRQIMRAHGIKHRAVHVDLVEAWPRLLPRMPADTSRLVRRRLRRLGVRLYLGKAVEGLSADSLTVASKPILSHTVIWTAGVTNHPFFQQNNFAITKRGKVATDLFLQAEDNIYVIGDNANTPYSGMAQTALRDGAFVANNLRRLASGHDMVSYRVRRPVTVIPVGQRWAVVVWGRLRLYGWLGWMMRQAADLVGFHDYEPWQKATEQWITEFGAQDSCRICLRSS